MSEHDRDAIARAIVDSNRYMTIATADASGRPWASPVYYAAAAYSEFFWVSSPDAVHSRNIASRPEVTIVVFDSRAPVGEGQAVYISALAAELTGADLDRGIQVFSKRSVEHAPREWTVDDVRPPAFHRLYRAAATERWILDPGDHPIHGKTGDHRTPVSP
jgi:nitroimidazol reductase NimA-like FMN-containing flavoprotein (pyridoxamine 5'-phosphate oxidase superfamily)